MTTDGLRELPLLNPVLTLRKEPRRERVQGGGKNAGQIVRSRLAQHTHILSSACRYLYDHRDTLPTHGGKTLLVARMSDDSLAPTYKPDSMFDWDMGFRLVAPFRHGYLVEASIEKLPHLAHLITNPTNIASIVDISRVEALSPFDEKAMLAGRSLDRLWEHATEVEGGREFIVWLAPYQERAAKLSLMSTLETLAAEGVLQPTFPVLRLHGPVAENDEGYPVPVEQPQQTGVARALRQFRRDGHGRATIRFTRKQDLARLVASGTSFRIDPVKPLQVTAPGEGQEPGPPPPDVSSKPIVGVVDGGLTARSYLLAEAWRATPSFVHDGHADTTHGNRITSLIVQAHAWNSNLDLPPLVCRVGTVQAVPRQRANLPYNPEALIDYLTRVVREHPETKIWNFSFNQITPEDDFEVISYLGDAISRLARAAGILPVISIGNVSTANQERLCPPADCEAALVVAGRTFDDKGTPSAACNLSLRGPGPDGMWKPDVSWFSKLRVIGGETHTGTSYAATLVSNLAAHTWDNLKQPSPDLVKALLLNCAERESFDPQFGWGTPWNGHMPWICRPGSVTLAWCAELRPGIAYYFNDIPIPPELVRDRKLFGKASLTAILRPLTSPEGGPNYFATRLQVALQYTGANGKVKNLCGSMREDKDKEMDARQEHGKWHPIRRHVRDFTKKSGIAFSGDKMKLFARVFARDLYQFELDGNADLKGQEVAFVLTLSDGREDSAIYNSMARALGNFVESAVLDQEIEIGNAP